MTLHCRRRRRSSRAGTPPAWANPVSGVSFGVEPKKNSGLNRMLHSPVEYRRQSAVIVNTSEQFVVAELGLYSQWSAHVAAVERLSSYL